MIIYRATKKEFVDDVFNNTISDNIDQAFVEHLGRHTSPNEVRSWANSMQFMYKVVNIPELPDEVGVAIEYQIPLTAKRVDFIISGLNGKQQEQIIIIELKQWETAEATNKPGIVVGSFPTWQSRSRSSFLSGMVLCLYAFQLQSYYPTTWSYSLSVCLSA